MKDWINSINTTALGKIVFMLVVVATATRYIVGGMGFKSGTFGGLHFDTWEPAGEWLMFLLAVLVGADGTLIGKRLTDYEYKKIAGQAKQPTVNAETANVKAEGDVNVNTTSAPEATP